MSTVGSSLGITRIASVAIRVIALVLTDDLTILTEGMTFPGFASGFCSLFRSRVRACLDLLEFCGNKGIKQEYSNARTLQQNGVAERMNRTLIEAARTMLADSLLPTTFWAEAVSTASCNSTSEVTNNAGTSQTPNSNASEEKDEDIELIVVPSAVKITEEKVESRTSSTNSKKEEILTDPQQEKKGQLDPDDSPMPELEIFHKSETGIFDEASYDEEGVITDFNSLPTEIEQKSGAHALLSYIQKQQRNNHKDQQHCLFACFLSQEEPKKIAEALQDDSWVQAMQEELLQFKLQQAWLGGIRHDVAQEGTHNKSIDYDEVFAPVERIEAIRIEEAVDVDVTPKTSHLNVVKRIFKYLKGKPNLGLWYLRESPFDLETFSDSDYAEYVDAANCCGQVLWVQNQLLDYGFNFMNTKIHIDNESTICIVKNPVYHSKTKHIEIRHHFIRDCYEKKLISVEKIHTDLNVADLLTKPFDGPRFNYLVVSIGMINP
ncbi:putative ribonuclease H-like domain-containing protein [Tanacetum coccineum]